MSSSKQCAKCKRHYSMRSDNCPWCIRPAYNGKFPFEGLTMRDYKRQPSPEARRREKQAELVATMVSVVAGVLWLVAVIAFGYHVWIGQ